MPESGSKTSTGVGMTVSGIPAPSTNNYQSSSSVSGLQQSFVTLVSALISGNLSSAQQAYSSLNQLQSNGQGPSANSPASQALSRIGQALQSGNLTVAQQALSSLQQAQSGHHHGHHSHHGGGESSTVSTNTAPSPLGAAASAANALNITA